MASFFGEVVTGSYRYIDDEDEDLIESAKADTFSFSEPLEAEQKLLVFAEGDLSVTFTQLLGLKLATVSSTAGDLVSGLGLMRRGVT